MLNIFFVRHITCTSYRQRSDSLQTEVQTSHFHGVITSLILYYLKHAYKKQLHFLCI